MERVTPARQNPLHALLQYRSFRLLWAAGISMHISEWVQTITLGWLALTLTDSPAFVGQVSFMSGVPVLLLTLPAGALLDRIDRRRVLLATQIVGALLALTVGFFASGNHIAPWHLLIAAVLNGSLLAVSLPATQALVPDVVEREDLTNALGLNAAGVSATRMLGPSLGGIIIGAAGVVWCFMFQAVGLLFAGLCSFLMRPNPRGQRQARQRNSRTALGALRDDPMLQGLLLQAMAPGLLAYPVLALLPVLARDQLALGPGGLGVLMTASGIGATAGSFVVASLGSYPHKGRLMLLIGVSYGFALTAFAQSPWILVSCVLFACSSCLGVLHNALTTALLQTRAPEELRGQLTGALTLSFGLTPIGALGLGALAERIGVSNAISCGALASSLCIALTMLGYRSLLRL